MIEMPFQMIAQEIGRDRSKNDLILTIYFGMDFIVVNVLTKYWSSHQAQRIQKCQLLKNLPRLQQDC